MRERLRQVAQRIAEVSSRADTEAAAGGPASSADPATQVGEQHSLDGEPVMRALLFLLCVRLVLLFVLLQLLRLDAATVCRSCACCKTQQQQCRRPQREPVGTARMQKKRRWWWTAVQESVCV